MVYELGIIACTKNKIWDVMPNIGPVQAGVAYTGIEFILSRHYVSKLVNRIIIFSAKFGFMDVSDPISSWYDVTFSRENDPYISIEELKQQAEKKELYNYNSIITTCNLDYQKRILQVFSKVETDITCPIAELRQEEEICYRLNELINELDTKIRFL